MLKKKTVGILTTSEDYKSIINLNFRIYKKITEKYGKIYIINLKNLLFLKQKKNKATPNNLNLNIKIFEPKNSDDFLNFVKDKKLIAFNGLGKDLSTFKIHYILSKINLVQILLMNIGYLGNEIALSTKNLNNLISSLQFKISRKFSRYLFRIATILKIFPKIDYYFESSLPLVKNLNNNLIKKFEKKLKFVNLSYFKKVILLNSRSYDDLYDDGKKSKKYIVFVDTFFDHPDREIREGKIKKNTTIQYYQKLNFFLNHLNKIYKKKIIICIHPKNTKPLARKYFSKFKIVKHKTNEMIKNANIVIFHESSAALDAVLLKKNIINLQSNLLGNYLSKRCSMYSNILGLFTINLDLEFNFKKNYLNKNFNHAIKNYNKYINNYLNSNGKKPGYKKILNIINKI